MSTTYNKICKISDDRIKGYVNRTRNGSLQVFYTGNDSRDFERYRLEGGGKKHNVEMHDKPDTININPPEKHFYAELIDGEWWWVNGCAECNGRPRDWTTYIECDEHNVCRTCKMPRAQITEIPWAGKSGWQCTPCADAKKQKLKEEALKAFDDAEYDEHDFRNTDEITCPHCATKNECDLEHYSDSEFEMKCRICDEKFAVEKSYIVSYTTRQIQNNRFSHAPKNKTSSAPR